jgi:hypothetical protein
VRFFTEFTFKIPSFDEPTTSILTARFAFIVTNLHSTCVSVAQHGFRKPTTREQKLQACCLLRNDSTPVSVKTAYAIL